MLRTFAGTARLPVRENVIQKKALVFFGNLKGIDLAHRHQVQLLLIKKAKFRENRGAAGFCRMVSHDQLFLIYKDRHMLQKISKRLCAAQNVGLSFGGTIAFRHEAGPLHADFRYGRTHALVQKFGPLCPAGPVRKQ